MHRVLIDTQIETSSCMLQILYITWSSHMTADTVLYNYTEHFTAGIVCVEAIKILSCHFAPIINTIFNTTKHGNLILTNIWYV